MKDYKDLILKIFNTILLFHKSLGKEGNIHSKFRISSYQKAISSIEKLNHIYSIKNVQKIPGIGKGFQDKIDEIIKTGSLKMYKEIENNKEMKAINLFQLIWGVGVEKARDFVLKDKIYTINELKKKVESGKIHLNEQQKIGLKYFDDLQERIPRQNIKKFTNYLKNKLKKYKIKIENGGSYRLGKKDSGDIDLIFTIKDWDHHTMYAKYELIENIIDNLKGDNIILDILTKGDQKIICIIKDPNTDKIHQMDIFFIDREKLPWYLLYFGSSKEFSKYIRRIAIEKGYKLSEQGIYNRKTNKKIDFTPKTEKNIFKFLNIKYIIPKKRLLFST